MTLSWGGDTIGGVNKIRSGLVSQAGDMDTIRGGDYREGGVGSILIFGPKNGGIFDRGKYSEGDSRQARVPSRHPLGVTNKEFQDRLIAVLQPFVRLNKECRLLDQPILLSFGWKKKVIYV